MKACPENKEPPIPLEKLNDRDNSSKFHALVPSVVENGTNVQEQHILKPLEKIDEKDLQNRILVVPVPEHLQKPGEPKFVLASTDLRGNWPGNKILYEIQKDFYSKNEELKITNNVNMEENRRLQPLLLPRPVAPFISTQVGLPNMPQNVQHSFSHSHVAFGSSRRGRSYTNNHPREMNMYGRPGRTRTGRFQGRGGQFNRGNARSRFNGINGRGNMLPRFNGRGNMFKGNKGQKGRAKTA